MFTIVDVFAREILDSRGNPTVEAQVELSGGADARAAVPSGASTGQFEALELRDGDNSRYLGRGVEKAVQNVNDVISDLIIGMDARSQADIDYAMIARTTPKTNRYWNANAMLAVSLAGRKQRQYSWPAAVPVYRRLQRTPAAGAHDEHHQWRQACGQQRGHTGVHDHAHGRDQL